jgi:hypothetical protein
MRILDEWSRYREKKKRQRRDAAALVELIERMVQDSDPSIRNAAGYQQQLQKPVANALGYIEGLVSSITGPSILSAEAWDKDPLIHALFVSPDEIRSLLQDCAELKTFFQHSGSPTAVVLLTATKKERTIFGTALEGDIIKRDVPQVAVEFYDHQVVAPVATEGENRRELIHRGLALLATQTLEEILRIHSLREELSSERRMLAVKLKIQHSRERGLERLLTGGVKKNEDEGQALQLLEEIDHQLQELEPGSGAPQDFLCKLEEVLLNPGGVLMGKTLQMRLNWMGAKLSAESTENVPEINLFELEIPGRAKRVAVLANISLEDCLSRSVGN